MTVPVVTVAKGRLILSYDLANIKCLGTAVKQVFGILRIIVKRNDFLLVKKSTTIKIEKIDEDGKKLRMHFIIPVNVKDAAVVRALLNEDTADLLDQQKDLTVQQAS